MPFGLHWEVTAPRAIAAELLRRFPHKAPSIHPEGAAVQRILADIETAWRCFTSPEALEKFVDPRTGEESLREVPWSKRAAGALFDVKAAILESRLPLPDAVDWALSDFTARALSNNALTGGKGSTDPLALHLSNLRKRRRYEVMCGFLDTGRRYARLDDPARGAVAMGADAEAFAAWQAERPEGAASVAAAAAMAAEELRENVDVPAMWKSFREVEAAANDRTTWPGRFYLPSRATCDFLGWTEALHPLCDEGRSDAPWFGVA